MHRKEPRSRSGQLHTECGAEGSAARCRGKGQRCCSASGNEGMSGRTWDKHGKQGTVTPHFTGNVQTTKSHVHQQQIQQETLEAFCLWRRVKRWDRDRASQHWRASRKNCRQEPILILQNTILIQNQSTLYNGFVS